MTEPTITITITEQQAEAIRTVLLPLGSDGNGPVSGDEEMFDALADLFDVQGDNDYNLGLTEV